MLMSGVNPPGKAAPRSFVSIPDTGQSVYVYVEQLAPIGQLLTAV